MVRRCKRAKILNLGRFDVTAESALFLSCGRRRRYRTTQTQIWDAFHDGESALPIRLLYCTVLYCNRVPYSIIYRTVLLLYCNRVPYRGGVNPGDCASTDTNQSGQKTKEDLRLLYKCKTTVQYSTVLLS